MQEFWDNSQEHKDDIVNFINGRVTPSNYFNGIFSYWVGRIGDTLFCLILTAQEDNEDGLPQVWQQHLSTTGTTYSLDFGIGNVHYLGQKLASPTLKLFAEFIQKHIDPAADTFFIDPAEDNPRAIHVYEQAGFKQVGAFTMEKGVFKGEQTQLMVMKLPKILTRKNVK